MILLNGSIGDAELPILVETAGKESDMVFTFLTEDRQVGAKLDGCSGCKVELVD